MKTKLPAPLGNPTALRGRLSIRKLLEARNFTVANLVMPILINENSETLKSRLPSTTLRQISKEIKSLNKLGIKAVKLFATSASRSRNAHDAVNNKNTMCQAIDAVKQASPEMCVITEACLCPYTHNGACVLSESDGKIKFAESLDLIASFAVYQAEQGADIIGPSAMLPTSVQHIRNTLNTAGHFNVSIMPHIIVQSALYTLYRRAIGVEIASDAKGALQIPRNAADQCIAFASQMIKEGADMLLMEPALFILDIISSVRHAFTCPIAAFSVSGEYHLISSSSGVDEDYAQKMQLEHIESIRRAGSDVIITYFAKSIAALLRSQQ